MKTLLIRLLGPVIRAAPRGLKRPIKNALHRARKAWINRFYSFSEGEILEALRKLGVRDGDLVCVHSSFDQFGGFRGDAVAALRVLQRAVGSGGGLMMPNQPWGGDSIEYVKSGRITGPRTPSAMGLLTELLRRAKGAVRTVHPTHPVCLWGPRGVSLAGEDWKAATPCGRGTAYYRLLEEDGLILMAGVGLEYLTFYHCAEELLEDELPFSPFTDEAYEIPCLDAAGVVHTARMRLYEPVLSSTRNMAAMIPFLKRANRWNQARVGRLDMILVRARDVVDTCREMARAGHYCYRVIPAATQNGNAPPVR